MNLKFLFLLITIGLLFSCKNDKALLDVSHIKPTVQIHRFDQALSKIDTNDTEAGLKELKAQYNTLYDLYFNRILVLTNKENTDLASALSGFLSDNRIKKLNDTLEILFGDFTPFEKDLKRANQYYKNYFPNRDFPNFYTLMSEYSIQNFIFPDGEKDGIGIGLDMFLGADFPYKELDPGNPSFSNYLTRSYNKDHLIKKAMDPLVADLVGKPNGRRMIDKMINYGKRLHILEKLIPFKNDTVIYEFSQNQLDWLKANELEVWSYFLEKTMVYETSSLQINKYLEPGPKSPGMPDEAPARTGVFIGKKIVDKYMKKHPNLSLEDLILEKDAQKILEGAKYKPKRK